LSWIIGGEANGHTTRPTKKQNKNGKENEQKNIREEWKPSAIDIFVENFRQDLD
jgi:hypothetical protein